MTLHLHLHLHLRPRFIVRTGSRGRTPDARFFLRAPCPSLRAFPARLQALASSVALPQPSFHASLRFRGQRTPAQPPSTSSRIGRVRCARHYHAARAVGAAGGV